MADNLGPMWLHHLINLPGRSWHAMTAATSTNTLGFIVWTVAITAMGWVATTAARWLELKREKVSEPFRKAVLGSATAGAFLGAGVFILVVVAWGIFIIRTVYYDHQGLVTIRNQLLIKNRQLCAELKWRQHNISTTDAVFPNIIYMLQAFNGFYRPG